MWKIVYAKDNDYPSLGKCYRRMSEQAEALPSSLSSEPDFPSLQRLFVAKDGARVIGAISLSRDLGKSLFPESQSPRKLYSLLGSIDYQADENFVIDFIYVDPAYIRKGIGSALVKAVESQYPLGLFIAPIPLASSIAEAFFMKLGYHNFGIVPDLEINPGLATKIYAKKVKRDGLCRDINW